MTDQIDEALEEIVNVAFRHLAHDIDQDASPEGRFLAEAIRKDARAVLERQPRDLTGWLKRVMWALDHASGMASVHGDLEFHRSLQELIAFAPEPTE